MVLGYVLGLDVVLGGALCFGIIVLVFGRCFVFWCWVGRCFVIFVV